MAPSLSKLLKLAGGLRSWRAGIAATLALLVAVLYKAFTAQISFFGSAPLYTEFPELAGTRLPQYSILTPSFLNSIWPLIATGILLSFLAFRFAKTMAKASTNVAADNQIRSDQAGTGSVEFVLLLPPLAALLLMILQIALIVQAKFVVNYAAFCAARSAIVIIPDDVNEGRPPEWRNQLGKRNRSEKVEIIHRAAAFPLTAISPLPGASAGRGLPILDNPDATAELVKLIPFDVTPRSMVGQAMLRAPYAYDERNTKLTILTPQGSDGGNFKDHDWVTVKVTYRYYLTVPFAEKLFGTSYDDAPFLNVLFGTDYYYEIAEQYSLPMDGEPSGL